MYYYIWGNVYRLLFLWYFILHVTAIFSPDVMFGGQRPSDTLVIGVNRDPYDVSG